ncbi:MAG: signal peptidase II [Candidatus Buchananbacteria bacterium RIFCSPHIGHO2_02_FULL_40_13]|uniref:Lipoprotein signal peptidase n=1 Tax=Candidatus Buchananbacteria bacterium RIFCSPLOWO2_01_FULL_39_33 TaxID=1797543 RepID=A0A1G1YG86_9BACT|nr:MAG: signal peptidase II [Candidatus Buchananbacteria bacterium RIFCSPHIGHO2_02_FULL_40_13]OGY51271.1 MAG: signal peptidase II [Candidatus Buchananbacteria bacterium RIFCSPLOWO2_01_FULL_39_33]
MNRKKHLLINLAAISLFIIDIFLKRVFLAWPGREYFVLGLPAPVGDILKLKLATNSGIAFGIPVNQQLFLYFYIFIFLILGYWLVKEYRRKNLVVISALTLIIFGALSNFFDRLFLGAVVDYLDLKYYSVFNLADVMIVFGVIMIIASEFKKSNLLK